jgi:hypothetical protein
MIQHSTSTLAAQAADQRKWAASGTSPKATVPMTDPATVGDGSKKVGKAAVAAGSGKRK